MSEYADIVKALRMCAVPGNCSPKCPRAGIGDGCIRGLKTKAADAIEKLVLKLDKANNSGVKTNNPEPKEGTE